MKNSKARPEYSCMRSSFFIFILIQLAILPFGFSQDDEKTDVTYICQRSKDIRWIRSYKVEGNRCKSLYSKDGYVQTVSSAQNFASCKTVIDNIKANIEEGGFKCKEAQLISMVEID